MAPPKHVLKVGVIGPKGQCGSCVTDELLSRGHFVVGISRSPPKTWPGGEDKYSSKSVDLVDDKATAEILSDGFDAIVSAYGPPMGDLSKLYRTCAETQAKIKAALLRSSHTGPFIVIGGAGSLKNKEGLDFVDEPGMAYEQWYVWPDQHFHYMETRTNDHGSTGFSWFIAAFRWAKNNVENPGSFSWLLRPVAWGVLAQARKSMTSPDVIALLASSRLALRLYEGVTTKKWSFLSPPWLLRDKGVRTGKYDACEDSLEKPAYHALEQGIYNEDMAVAIVDECENDRFAYKHWTCTGPIDVEGRAW